MREADTAVGTLDRASSLKLTALLGDLPVSVCAETWKALTKVAHVPRIWTFQPPGSPSSRGTDEDEDEDSKLADSLSNPIAAPESPSRLESVRHPYLSWPHPQYHLPASSLSISPAAWETEC